MHDDVRNFLYRQPELYEKVYPALDDELPDMCQRMFERYIQHIPDSILDIGCGTGRELMRSLLLGGSETLSAMRQDSSRGLPAAFICFENVRILK